MSTLLLFDVDGTLTHPMKPINCDMVKCLKDLKSEGYFLGIVGGSNINKIKSQIGDNIELFDHVFAENGTVIHHKEGDVVNESVTTYLGDTQYNLVVEKIVNTLFSYRIPIRRGTFVELRNSCLNISPIGRNCSYNERIEFKKYDDVHHIRQKIIDELSTVFNECGLSAVIGGMISFDVYPNGWDKTYCLKFLDYYETIHFFGDNTHVGGNDNSIYEHDRTIGYSIRNPEHLMDVLSQY